VKSKPEENKSPSRVNEDMSGRALNGKNVQLQTNGLSNFGAYLTS